MKSPLIVTHKEVTDMRLKFETYEAVKERLGEQAFIMLFDDNLTPEERPANPVEVKLLENISFLEKELIKVKQELADATKLKNVFSSKSSSPFLR